MSPRSVHPTLVLSLLAALAGGCSEPSAPGGDRVLAEAVDGGIRVTNSGARTVTYMAYNPGWLATANLAPMDCSQPGNCPSIAPHSSFVIPWQSISGFDPSVPDYVVSWALLPGWRVDPDERHGAISVSAQAVIPHP